jgi:hypothetical protein
MGPEITIVGSFAVGLTMRAPKLPIFGETMLGSDFVRTGAFDPWGNILLYSGVDVLAWFSKPGVKAPDYYAKKLKKG